MRQRWASPDLSFCADCNYANAVVALRTANESITRVTPLMIKLMPTSVPITQAELDGHCR